ncbi:tRNA pseudouridine(55) synthase TruB [Oscillospiraceae bacterium CM]|nr:tRNA pseudouridine(55) synthase TruB [Oscillospiraceae bacterium CM]
MNGIVVVDKPAGWTSHDVVAKLRGVLHEKRIGHGGTLDPMATGVLPVFIGRATRAVSFCEVSDKEYLAGLRLGIVTDTQDTTGQVLKQSPVPIKAQDIDAVLGRFIGPQQQLPPMYSAIKIGGQKLYQLARRGIEIARETRAITIQVLERLDGDGPDVLLRVVCSKGTYVRTLCHDIGAALGCGGAMSSLRRTRVGTFTLDDAVTLDEIIASSAGGSSPAFLKSVDTLFSLYPAIVIDGSQEKKCRNGADFAVMAEDGRYRVYDADNQFLMLGNVDGGMMRAVKNFFE